MLGMNLPDNDDWTTALLTNPEVLAVNQDSAGKFARHISVPGQTPEVWARKLSDSAQAVGFFNRTDSPIIVDCAWHNLGIAKPVVRDLWLQKDLGRQQSFTAELPPRGCALVRLK